MITKKYDYKKLKRKNIDGKRFYVVDGENYAPAASVTTILSATKAQKDVEALKRWRRNVGYGKAQQITKQAANRGTKMHSYLEEYCNTGIFPTPGTNPYIQQANLMAACIAQYGFIQVDEVWGTEVPVYFPNIYGGTTDCAGIHDGDEAIIDFKQSNKRKKREWIDDYFIQLTAYAEAHNEMHGTKIRKGVIMMCTQDWEYQEFIIKDKEFDKYRKIWWSKVEQYVKMAK